MLPGAKFRVKIDLGFRILLPYVTTSQRYNVTTSQRYNVTPSQRHNVTTSHRLDFTYMPIISREGLHEEIYLYRL